MLTSHEYGIQVVAAASTRREFTPLSDDFRGCDNAGNEIGFTNFYATINGRPTYMVMGEFLFSRVEPWQWEDELIKLKAGGVNVVSFYLYWNLHEPVEGEWHFEGRGDVRRFVQLIAKHGLYAVTRIGPYVHSEWRNGGLPDWLFGQPYEVREVNDGFLKAVKRFYNKLGEQLHGLFYKDGGPIIACQVDNEYEHSTSPWEMTTGMTNEWVNIGHGGDAYLKELREMAEDAGFVVPFYTATAWGGAVTTDRAMPMWGGYPFRPWLFYQINRSNAPKEHPQTQEYLYQDFSSSQALQQSRYDLYSPQYAPESMPYVCCEMGAGMFTSYDYRFSVPQRAPDALANIKMASGCNFLGYYIYKSGTNPIVNGQYMNETQAPRIQYDFRGPMGEFGQLNESYFRYKVIHQFAHAFGEDLCRMSTFLSANAYDIKPSDTDTLRYAVRAHGTSGFLFINNFQDHAYSPDKTGFSIRVRLEDMDDGNANAQCDRNVVFANLGIASDENCILPFGLDCDGVRLEWANIQPLVRETIADAPTYVFFLPSGMSSARLHFADGVVAPDLSHGIAMFDRIAEDGHEVRFIVLNRDYAEQLYVIDSQNGTGKALLFARAAVLQDERDFSVRLESECTSVPVVAYPASALAPGGASRIEAGAEIGLPDCFARLVLNRAPVDIPARCEQSDINCWSVIMDPAALDDPSVKNILLDVDYVGDVAQAYVDGILVHDNFANGETWRIGLHELRDQLAAGKALTLKITPLKQGVVIDVDSPMAARQEHVDKEIGELSGVRVSVIYEYQL